MQIAGFLVCDESNFEEEPQEHQLDPTGSQPASSALRVQVRQSPYLDAFHRHHPIRIIIDSEAIGNMIPLSTVQKLGMDISKSARSAHQTDGSSPLKVTGKTKLSFARGNLVFQFEGLIVENLDVEVLAGTPFKEINDVAVRPARRTVTLGDSSSFTYGSPDNPSLQETARRATVLRAPTASTTVCPGDWTSHKARLLMHFMPWSHEPKFLMFA